MKLTLAFIALFLAALLLLPAINPLPERPPMPPDAVPVNTNSVGNGHAPLRPGR